MSNILIGGTDSAGDSALPIITSADPINDLIPIYQNGTNSTNAISLDNFLGITGSPVGTSDSQSLSNKTLGNTNTLTIKDASSFTIQNASDVTKQGRFSLAGLTAGNTRTYTLPDYNATLASLAGIETMTNKTLTSPTINTAVIVNPTLTVDSIAGFSSGTVVSIANLSISNGVLNSNNSVITTNITDGNVTPAKLQSGTGGSWAWTSYTPTFANTTLGNGSVAGAYIQIGKTVFFRARFTMGSTSAVSTNPTVTLPITSTSQSNGSPIGNAVAGDINNGVSYPGVLYWITTTTCQPNHGTAGGTYVQAGNYTSTTPFLWATNDVMYVSGAYEAA